MLWENIVLRVFVMELSLKKQTNRKKEIRYSLSDIVFHWNALGSAIIVQTKN